MSDGLGEHVGAILSPTQMAELRRQTQDVHEAHGESAQILEQARFDAQKLLEAANARSQHECTERLDIISSAAERKFAEEVISLEADVAELVATTVRSVIGELEPNDAIERATRTALQQLADHKIARIRAAPAAFGAVSKVVDEGVKPVIVDVSLDEELTGDRVVFSSDRAVAELGLSEQIRSATEPWVADKT